MVGRILPLVVAGCYLYSFNIYVDLLQSHGDYLTSELGTILTCSYFNGRVARNSGKPGTPGNLLELKK